MPEDAGLYLCKPLPKILDEDEEEELSAPPHHKKAAVSLVSGVNILPDKLGESPELGIQGRITTITAIDQCLLVLTG